MLLHRFNPETCEYEPVDARDSVDELRRRIEESRHNPVVAFREGAPLGDILRAENKRKQGRVAA